MNKLRGISARLAVPSMVVFLAWAAPCFADTYDINFDASSGPTPTGSFSYTDGSGFSDLIVTVSGLQFDFTSEFNTGFLPDATGPFCTTLSQSEVAFEFLEGQSNCLGSADQTYSFDGSEEFSFESGYTIPNGPLEGFTSSPGASASQAIGTAGDGSFTITDLSTSAVPEPSSLTTVGALALALGLALGWKRRGTKGLAN